MHLRIISKFYNECNHDELKQNAHCVNSHEILLKPIIFILNTF